MRTSCSLYQDEHPSIREIGNIEIIFCDISMMMGGGGIHGSNMQTDMTTNTQSCRHFTLLVKRFKVSN